MADTAYDPLRDDPFAPVNQAPAIVPVANQPNNQWGVNGQHQSQPQPGYQPESNEDILLQFNNTNASQSNRMRNNSGSSVGSRSVNSKGSAFANPNIAPPPQYPIQRDYTASQFHTEEEYEHAPPPDFNEVTHSGTCIARISMRTLVLKKWKRCFWISYGETKMLFFRSKIDFEEWVMNPHLSSNQREKLVKLRIDFENPNKSTRKDTEVIKGFHASAVKGKMYKGAGIVNQFKLDKWTDQGPTITAAFGSKTPEEVSELHAIVTEMLQQNPTNAAFSAAMLDARDGDSSGHYPSEYSVGSNPTFARSPSGDDISYHSGYDSSRSVNSSGSKSKYLINNVKSSLRSMKAAR